LGSIDTMFVMGVGSLNHCDPAKVAPHCSEVSTFALVTMHKGNEVPEKLYPLLPLQFLLISRVLALGDAP
jgi:Ni2+-binding GTPase involved in maturation of urease and hydrogenase